MGTALNFVAGAAVAAVIWVALRPAFDKPIFARRNYRGVDVPVGAGLVLALATIGILAVEFTWTSVRSGPDGWFNYAPRGSARYSTDLPFAGADVLVLVVVVAFALLGLFDDLGAAGDDRGFRGHLHALRQGRLTTGLVKLVFGGLVAVAVVARIDTGDTGSMVFDAPLVALAANVGNLFDRAPGRTTKVALLAGLPLLVLAGGSSMHAVAAVLGAGAGLLVFDLREELMLGDTGSNVLGAALGLGVVIGCPVPVRINVALVLLALNLASEKVSFSKVIDRVAPLRFLDRLGRRPVEDPPTAPL